MDPRLSQREHETAYRPIAMMAVVSLAAGLVALSAFATPVFWVLPFLALVVVVPTMVRLQRAQREYAGQLLVKFALLLVLIAAIGAPTRYLVERAIVTREARRVANLYLDNVLANNVKGAFVWRVPPLERSGMESDPDQLIVRFAPGYRTYVSSRDLDLLGGKGTKAQVALLPISFDGFRYANGYYRVTLPYRISLDDKVVDVEIDAVGGVASGGEWQGRKWVVSDVRLSPRG